MHEYYKYIIGYHIILLIYQGCGLHKDVVAGRGLGKERVHVGHWEGDSWSGPC